MTPERWSRLQELYQAASDLDPARREDYLGEACGADVALRRQVESLLVQGAETGPAGVRPPRVPEAGFSPPHEVVLGGHVGPYRLEREVGQGGMGTVYLAVRDDDEYRKQVAVKVLLEGLRGDEARRRFRRERQILANLDHPHIARLLDGGTTEGGLPYLVMEYVEGDPITDYADRRRLPVPDRLRLFRSVCSAVQYAHQNLVVHRDLKPSNILVGGNGVPKLLDFGIAKLMQPDTEAAAVALTQTHVRLMTPDYASPEQVRGETVTTTSDVYSLGVVLYELLTGRRPHLFDTHRLEEVERRIRQEEPPRPSASLLTATQAQAEVVARQRSAHLEPLRRQLEGDLDNVVMKALQKEPSRRYPSAEQLSEDLRRHLEGLPVTARADTFRYRAGKFVRRHRAAVGVAAGFVALLAAFGATMAVQASRLARERNRALAAEDRARTEAETARRVSAFLVDLFRIPDPSRSRGQTVTAREILDQGSTRIATELKSEPLVQARLMDTMGTVYRKLGLHGAARTLLEGALETRRRLLGDDDPDTAASMNSLAEVLREMTDLEAAEPLYRKALEVRRRTFGPQAPQVAESLNNLGLLRLARGDAAEAERLYREALAIRRDHLGLRHPDTATTMSNLGQLLRDRGQLPEGESLLREVLGLRRQVLGRDHPHTANSMDNLGRLLHNRGDYPEAERLFRETLEVRRRVLGEEHPEYAMSLNNLAALLHDKGDYDAADPLYRQVLAAGRKRQGDDHLDVAITLNNLASLLEDRGDPAGAVPLYRESLAIRLKRLGEDHPSVARVRHNLGRALMATGRLGEAEALMRQALEIRRKRLGPEHTEVASSLAGLGALMREKRDLKEAERLYREAVDLRRKVLPAGHAHTAEAVLGLGIVLTEAGRAREAEALLREVVEGQRKSLGNQHPLVGRGEAALGACLAALGNAAEAEKLLESGHATLVTRLGPGHRYTREAARWRRWLEEQ